MLLVSEKESVEPLPRWPFNKGWFINLAAALCFFSSDRVCGRSRSQGSSCEGCLETTPPLADGGVLPFEGGGGGGGGTDVVVEMRPFCLLLLMLLPSLSIAGSLDFSGSSTESTGLTCRGHQQRLLQIHYKLSALDKKWHQGLAGCNQFIPKTNLQKFNFFWTLEQQFILHFIWILITVWINTDHGMCYSSS